MIKINKAKNIIVILVSILFVLTNSCEKEVSITQPKPPPEKGFVYFDSDPSDIKIYLNGKFTGRVTPDSVPYLEHTTHEIRLKKNLYRDSVFNLDIKNDEKLSIYLDYYTNPWMYGSIECISQPAGAEIFLNDSATGRFTPDTLDWIVPGYYELKYTYPEHRHKIIRVTVRSKQIPQAALTLQDTSVWVDFQTSNSDLPYDYLTDIVVDHNNNKWIGTAGLGLLKYDEKSFTQYLPTNSGIPGGSVQCLDVDEQNRIWVGTAQGLAIFDGNFWEIWNTYNSTLPSNVITSIVTKDPLNRWIGTNEGLFKISPDSGSSSSFNWADSILPSKQVTTISLDQNNDVWIGTVKGIAKYNGVEWSSYYNVDSTGVFPDSSDFLISNFITASAIDDENRIWFGHNPDNVFGFYYGISSIKDGVWSRSTSSNLPKQTIHQIYFDPISNYKWICTSSGLAKFSLLSTVTIYRSGAVPGLFSDAMRGIVKDKNGIIWITTSGGGLTKYKGEQFSKQ